MIKKYEIIDNSSGEIVNTLFDRDIANESWLALTYQCPETSFSIRSLNDGGYSGSNVEYFNEHKSFRNNYLKKNSMYNGKWGGGGQRNYNTNYNNRQYQGNNNYRGNGGNNRPPDYVKKSGAGSKLAVTKDSESKPCTWGWKASKRFGIIKYFCGLTKHSKKGNSKTGKAWISGIAVTVTNPQTGSKTLHWGMMYPGEGYKVVVDSLGIVINPKGGRGGVVARIGVKK